jgi:hypothetical protein
MSRKQYWTIPQPAQDWLDLEQIALMEVTSEDPDAGPNSHLITGEGYAVC